MIQTPNDEHIRFSAKFSCQWGGHKSQECRQAAAYWPLIQILIQMPSEGRIQQLMPELNIFSIPFDIHSMSQKKRKTFDNKRITMDHSDSVAPGKFFVRLWRSWSMHSALPWEGSDGSVVESCWDCWDGPEMVKVFPNGKFRVGPVYPRVKYLFLVSNYASCEGRCTFFLSQILFL